MVDYRRKADEIREAAKLMHLKVLVWGPGDPGRRASADSKKAYQKRLQIKQEIKGAFPRSEVHFSEDKEMVDLAKGLHGQLRKEAFQAIASDLVIMLDLGRGVDLELDHFLPTYSWFPPKVFLLLPRKYVNSKGLVKEVYDHLKPDQIGGFTPRQFDKCHVATCMALDAALAYAFDKLARGIID